mgnify:CR=1 FL=1
MKQSIKDKYKLSEEEHNKIYKEIEKLYDLLVEYLDGNYLDAEMIDTKLVRGVTFKVFTNKEISNNYKKSYQKSKS